MWNFLTIHVNIIQIFSSYFIFQCLLNENEKRRSIACFWLFTKFSACQLFKRTKFLVSSCFCSASITTNNKCVFNWHALRRPPITLLVVLSELNIKWWWCFMIVLHRIMWRKWEKVNLWNYRTIMSEFSMFIFVWKFKRRLFEETSASDVLMKLKNVDDRFIDFKLIA